LYKSRYLCYVGSNSAENKGKTRYLNNVRVMESNARTRLTMFCATLSRAVPRPTADWWGNWNLCANRRTRAHSLLDAVCLYFPYINANFKHRSADGIFRAIWAPRARERPRSSSTSRTSRKPDRWEGESRGERENSYGTRIFFFSALRVLNITLTLTRYFSRRARIRSRMYYIYPTRYEGGTCGE